MLEWVVPCVTTWTSPHQVVTWDSDGPRFNGSNHLWPGVRLSAKFPLGIFPQPNLSALELEKEPQSRRTNEKTNDSEYDVGNRRIIPFWIYLGWLCGRTRDPGCPKH